MSCDTPASHNIQVVRCEQQQYKPKKQQQKLRNYLLHLPVHNQNSKTNILIFRYSLLLHNSLLESSLQHTLCLVFLTSVLFSCHWNKSFSAVSSDCKASLEKEHVGHHMSTGSLKSCQYPRSKSAGS